MQNRTESEEQQALFEWANLMSVRYPELEYLFHIPNGGLRNASTAGRLKAEGVKTGVPDLCLPVPKGDWHGLFIELKVGKNRVSEKQEKWLQKLNGNGYKVYVCYGCEEAVKAIETYLKLRPAKCI